MYGNSRYNDDTDAAALTAVPPYAYGGTAYDDSDIPLSEGAAALMQLVSDFGYGYDAEQNVFYTEIDAWQRRYGYCSLYDEGTAISGMILDCEPIYFIYNGQVYMIELWKGQYDLTAGCEVGIYRDSGRKLLGTEWFETVPDDELLDMSMSLYRGGEHLFTRAQRHWWLTGFKLGEFVKPKDLTLAVRIRFCNQTMADAFLDAIRAVGYAEDEAFTDGDVVSVYFTKSKQRQPLTRRSPWITVPTQWKNKLMCKSFQAIVGGEDKNVYEILAEAKENYPDVYDEAIKISRRMEPYTKRMGDMPGIEDLLSD
ncbi:MAG: DUF4474 domain-containing protein [Oscillospiraceae bacterium]|nr:DUF4474 domain-containing protein [Oscillospiraceae bacterium]